MLKANVQNKKNLLKINENIISNTYELYLHIKNL